MNSPTKQEWLEQWAKRFGCEFKVGECGFCRPCVGIIDPTKDYWVMYDDMDRVLPGQPKDAYHKDALLCVLGEGEPAVSQLYDWCKALDDAGYTIQTAPHPYIALGIPMGVGPVSIHPPELKMVVKPVGETIAPTDA